MDPDLSSFKVHGGKLIMTYGWADTILQPMMGVNYYEQAVAKNGPDTIQFPASAPLKPGRRPGIHCRERLGGLLRYYGRAA